MKISLPRSWIWTEKNRVSELVKLAKEILLFPDFRNPDRISKYNKNEFEIINEEAENLFDFYFTNIIIISTIIILSLLTL